MEDRGRACKRKTEEKTVKRVLGLARGKYHGFNDHHLQAVAVDRL
jgi:hypothetical protein